MSTVLAHSQQRCLFSLESGMSVWVYAFGEVSGEDIKFGYSKEPTIRKRLRTVNGMQMNDDRYVLLAAVNGSTKDEDFIHDYFAEYRRPKGNRKEYYLPAAPVLGYVNWLRSRWWSSISEDDYLVESEMVESDHWLPGSGREIAPPPVDELKIVQDYEDPSDVLYNTAWSWMVAQKSGVQDYFTPPEIVDAAREAMGGIDLDAASHPLANRTHKIPDYFHTGRSAFHNDWYGRVWLNPPYGNNAPWFERIQHFTATGEVEQLCMLSPMWAFQTQLAQPVMEQTTGLMLLTPTPKFWGNQDPSKTGKNHPHGVIYIGSNPDRFHRAFARFGMPMKPAWTDTDLIIEGEAA